MVRRISSMVVFVAVTGIMNQSSADDSKHNVGTENVVKLGEPEAPRAFCRYVPERGDDFAWENDKVAFRVYGPKLRPRREDSGIDCWLKRVDYPIINRWYKRGKYHADHGEGHDPYHVGDTRGCGGLGLWIDGKLVNSDTYTKYKVIKNGPQEVDFILTYEWSVGNDAYKEEKNISLKMGDRLFKTTSTFWRNGELATNLPIAIGLSTHDGKAQPSKDLSKGWFACWEKIKDYNLGTGVVIDPSIIKDYKEIKDKRKDKSHLLLITETDSKGAVSYYAGYGWERAGEITTFEKWTHYLSTFSVK